MTISVIAAIAPGQITGVSDGAGVSAAMGATQQSGSASSFGEMVTQGVNAVNKELLVSQTDLQELAVGNAQNLHQIMIRMEETRLSFQLFMQVRNRLLEAYQDIMKMQV